MEWMKVATDSILLSEHTNREIITLLKYQALFCQLEREPNNIQLKKYLTSKDIQFLSNYKQSVSELSLNDIKSVKQKRGRDKRYYQKKQSVSKKSDGESDNVPTEQIREEKIRLDKIREDKKKIYKKEYGIFNNILLSDIEYSKLLEIYIILDNLETAFEKLSVWKNNKGKKSTHNYGSLLKTQWVFKDVMGSQINEKSDLSKHNENAIMEGIINARNSS